MTADVFRVALTGGIASGKSTVADMFGALGATLIDTDVIAREVVAEGSPGLASVVAKFGNKVLDEAGNLDRRALRHIVFSEENKRQELEKILHPLIRAETERQMQTAGGPYQMVIVPLLVESPLKEHVNRILVVDCSEQCQLERLLARDIETEAQAKRMIAAQSSRVERLALADDVISNDASMEQTREQVSELHRIYLELGSTAPA